MELSERRLEIKNDNRMNKKNIRNKTLIDEALRCAKHKILKMK